MSATSLVLQLTGLFLGSLLGSGLILWVPVLSVPLSSPVPLALHSYYLVQAVALTMTVGTAFRQVVLFLSFALLTRVTDRTNMSFESAWVLAAPLHPALSHPALTSASSPPLELLMDLPCPSAFAQ